jgi:hypothetical protein
VLRALIDWAVAVLEERSGAAETGSGQTGGVEDIPIA